MNERQEVTIPRWFWAIAAVALLWNILGGLRVMGPAGMVMPTLVTCLSISWLLFALFSQGKGWLAAYARPTA